MARKKGKKCDWTLVSPLVLRLVAGFIFLFAGLQKLFVFTPAGFGNNMLVWTGAPVFFAWIVLLVEIIAGLFLILGLWTRWASIPLGIIMIVAIILKWTNGILGFDAWGGYRLDLLLLAVLLSLFWLGGGKCSVDKFMGKA